MNPKFGLRAQYPASKDGVMFTANKFEVVGPQGVVAEVEVGGESGWSGPQARYLAQRICNRQNGVGRGYELQKWRVGVPGGHPDVIMPPHWHTEMHFDDCDAAIAERDRRNHLEPETHQVVMVLREVVR